MNRAADEALADLPEHRRELFGLRPDRRWPELADGLVAGYSPVAAEALALRLVRLAAGAYADRDPDLVRLDLGARSPALPPLTAACAVLTGRRLAWITDVRWTSRPVGAPCPDVRHAVAVHRAKGRRERAARS